MAGEQLNPQSSQLDEENSNKVEEAVRENNACSSSMQSGEVNVCLSSTSETLTSVQAIMPHCQFPNWNASAHMAQP